LEIKATHVEKLRSSSNWLAVRDHYYEALDGETCIRQTCALVNEEVRLAFEHLAGRTTEPLALFAVGGFGRGELFPYSDIDLMFLHPTEIDPQSVAGVVGPLTQLLWDRGLEPSHSVRSIRDITRFQTDNTEFYLSILDARPIAGDQSLIDAFYSARDQLLRQKTDRLVERLFDLLDARWRRYENTIHHLEPDIKDGPGGLRDLNTLHWLTTLKRETPFWDEQGRWQQFEQKIQRHLASIRCFLHYQEGRNQNVLRFDTQDEWLDLLARRGVGAGEWTREHYLQARTLYRELNHWVERYSRPATALQRGIEQWRSRLSNADFLVSRGVVHLKSPLQLVQRPETAMSLFAFLARHGVPASEATLARLRATVPHFRRTVETWVNSVGPDDGDSSDGSFVPNPLVKSLLEIFSLPYANLAVRAMDASGYLAVIFPEWQDIECLLVRDYYHCYTVDEHTLVCIDALCELLRGRKDLDLRMLDVAEQTSTGALVILALIFHDIGKKDGVEGHAERSATIAREALSRIGFDPIAAQTIVLLVEHHLLLSNAMRTRDLGDPATGAEISAVLGGLSVLRMLTLMTYADIRGVFPGALTPWRMDQLWSAFRVTQLSLEDRVARERILPAADYSPDELRYLEGFSTRYTRLFLPAQVRSHYALYQAMLEGGSGMRLRKVEANFELTAVCKDAPMLFAEVTALLAGMGQNILLADAFHNAHGVLLLRVRFDDPGRSLSLNPSDQENLKARLERVLYHGEPATTALPRRGQPKLARRHRQFEPYAYARNGVSPTLTMFEIGAADRPGLLYDITRTFAEHGCTIDVLIVETRAHRAFDTLYVQKEGRELSKEEQDAVRRALLAALRAGS
jgi:[protein-PII] uridylyltransferase